MNHRFAVQASNPRSLAIFDVDDQSLSDAIQTVFPLEAEYAIIVWNWVYIPLSYKYDVSMMADDLLDLVESMLSTEHGKRTIQWPSNTFSATWTVEWSIEDTTVAAEWHCVLGDTEALLASKPFISVRTAEFIGEWRRLFETIAAALMAAGYSPERVAGMRRLMETVGKIPECGILYRSSTAT